MPKTMRTVVDELLAEGADAVSELEELVLAIHEMRACSSVLAADAEQLATELEGHGALLSSGAAQLVRSRRVSTTAGQLAAAFAELEKGTDGWGLG